MIVSELIDHLLQGDLSAEVVVFDHFGHLIKMTTEDFSFREKIPPRASSSAKKIWYLSVTPIDIGPEPD